MKKFHIALSVADIQKSVEDYSRRLGMSPELVIENEYALWRTETLNFSIRRTGEGIGALRHIGWEDPAALSFTSDTDVNGVLWENFAEPHQKAEIENFWPSKK